MKTNLLILLALSFFGFAATHLLYNRLPVQAIKPVPDFTITDIAGNTHALADFRGKTVLLNFWASWCAPCIKEFPDLIQTARDNSGSAVLIALSSDIDDAAILKFLKKQKDWQAQNIIIARDTENITGEKFGTTRLPETLIIGPDGKPVQKLIGANWDIGQLQKIIEKNR